MKKVLFILFYGGIWLLTLLPLRVLYLFSDLCFALVYGVIKYRRGVVDTNLANAFPEKTDKERQRIAFDFYRHLCDSFFEILKLVHLSQKEVQRRVLSSNEYWEKRISEGRNVVAMAGHNGNWEWLTSVALKDDYHWVAPYHPLRNSVHFDKFMRGLRSRFGTEPVPMKSTYRRLMEINREGGLFVVGMIADQSPPNPKNRHWLTFMHQDTAVMEGSERIAQKTDACVVFCKMRKLKRGHYDVTFIPITEHPNEVEDFYITQRYFELLEEQIREQPEFWLWSHRRWKRQRPSNEKHIKQ